MDRAEASAVAATDGRDGWEDDLSPGVVVELLEPMVGDARRRRIQEVAGRRLDSVAVVMDAPHDPHNGAAVIRSCDAFGVSRLHVVERSEAFLVASGVTKGTDRWVEVVRHGGDATVVQTAHAADHALVTTHPEGRLAPEDLATLPRLTLVLGNEHQGISAELAGAARASVRVPMRGFVESLNVSVAAAILLYAATRGRPGDLSPERRQLLYARGLFRSVPRAAEVLDGFRARGAR